MLNPAAALCSLFTGHMIQTLLKIVMHKRRPQNQDSLNSAARFLPFVKIGVR